jgi:yecA family protein
MQDTTALSDDELEALDLFLETRCAPAGGIADVEMLDGYCSALATSPLAIPRETWLAPIWGDEAAFGSGEHDEAIRVLVERFDAEVRARIAAPPPPEDDDEARAMRLPLVLDDPDDEAFTNPPDGRSHFAEIWALGFELGYSLADEAWDAAREDWPAVDELLSVLAALLANVEDDDGGAGDSEPAPEQLDTEERLAALYALPDLLHQVQRIHAQQLNASTLRR